MLQFYPLTTADSIFELVENAAMASQSWIVSDLKSKNEIQKRLIEKQGYFLESSILRASDFWKIALRKLAPQIQVVASDFIRLVVDNFVEKFAAQLDLKTYEASTLLAYVQELAPILLHPESEQLLAEWFSQQEKIKKWQRWHLLAKACIKYIIEDHHIIDGRWTAAYLQNLDLSQLSWPADLVVDLGTEMSSVEMGLFKILSKKTNVKIIWPQPAWHLRYPLLLKTYHDNLGYGEVLQDKNEKLIGNFGASSFVRVSTQLAEVKLTVSQVRSWYEQGVPLDKIAIISSQIETYWPILKYLLDEEGLIYQKDHVIRLNSLGVVQNFLAYCNNLLAEVSWDSLEQSFFSRHSPTEVSFESFKSLFYQIYDDSDLQRDQKIKNLFYRQIDLHKKVSRDEFLSTVVKLWNETLQFHLLPESDHQVDLFEIIFKDFLVRSADVQSDFKRWLEFLKSCINSKEIKIDNHEALGLQVLPLMSSHLSDSLYQIWLGLDEKSLSSRKKHLLPVADIYELKTQFDFSIEYPEESYFDFNMRWLLEKNAASKIYICSNTNFEAEPLTPSLFFLERNALHALTLPPATRHDEVQNYLSQINFQNEPVDLGEGLYDLNRISLAGLKRDLIVLPNIVSIPLIDSITPSELEEYWKCGFKLLAQKVFRLKDLPQVAVDLDPRQKGSLLHQLFEFLIEGLQANTNLKLIEDSIYDFLDAQRRQAHIYPQDDLLWNIQKNKMALIGKAFIQFEFERKKPLQTTSEQSFELYFDLTNKEFLSAPLHAKLGLQKAIRFNGRIDRIDQQPNGIIIYDYKSATTDLSHYSDWLDNGEFQLLLYLVACEKVLFPNQCVIASVYYDYRKFDFSKGLMYEDFHAEHIQNSRRKKALATPEQKAALADNFILLLETLFSRLHRLDFSSTPVDVEICIRCNWSKLCRAHHLN